MTPATTSTGLKTAREGMFPAEAIHNGDLYKMRVFWNGGEGERIPAYARRMAGTGPRHQDFLRQSLRSGKRPISSKSRNSSPTPGLCSSMRAHIGMAENKESVGTYEEFRTNVLPG